MSIRDAKPFSEKMALLSRLCGSHDITHQEFRVMFALIIDFSIIGPSGAGRTMRR